MDPVIRSLILLQFVLCLPSLLAECRLSGVKLRILKVSLVLVMITFVLCDSCILEVLGVGLVLLNFCMLYGRKLNVNHNFYLLTLIIALMIFCGRIAWCGFSKFSVRKESCCLDHSQFVLNSKPNVNMTTCRRSSNGTHYAVCVKKDCNKVYVKN